ncbi:glycerol-3-phosphate dehydrogenase (NAD(P)+) [Hydrogenivirga caldilitoris]|uniref:Glycerol-3-phosphate dehydrogenase [NAD(P)+] n=1 Tax=Hydrogenivirga caldilitoris TaxID=246264 RepID=A0A497XVT6_9AQUI|nr:NAD(P)H-dependent glycerol-3-phosphate dehydrogenase [Hydrogenivirga caldilitoris]RLJ70893.1 glycerol-3-phosphate dehydrogenase (NAD(P)+) [Hydrogenivirga caldilitoris]
MRFAVIGGGRWGTALGVHLGRNGNEALIYDINEETVGKINQGIHPYTEGVRIPEGVRATTSIHNVEDYENLVCALPTQTVRSVFSQINLKGKRVINASKGLELKTFKRVSQIIKEIEQECNVFALSGPSFAEEVSKGLPTAVVLAYEQDEEGAHQLQRAINSENFRVYLNPDIVGVELGGALKNVIAIACGISDGLGFGYNARAALITRGLVEMTRIGVRLGAKKETFFGLSGAGDLILTSTSDLSRNRTFGFLLGKGLSPEKALKEIGQVVEGVKTAEALKELTDREGIYAPITEAVYRVIIRREELKGVLREMLLRSPGEEFSL